ncbi:MAG: nucleoside hydrolase [Erysipelotrichaceae bacterium]|nr:nucleoside hydrolase [Erysipelotrichaceae bacterium]
MRKRKIIFDVDTGSDDALAIVSALLCPEAFEVLGICTVAGNRPLPNTTDNTLRVLELLGRGDVPVIMGAEKPLVAKNDFTRVIRQVLETKNEKGETIAYHAESLPIPPTTHTALENEHAATWLIKTLMAAEEKITLVLTGPLTNFALAYRIAPEILDHVEEIVIMAGGDNQTNSTGAAEFNVFFDPEAAWITFDAGLKVPLTMMTLDATHQAYLTPADADRLRKMNNPLGQFCYDEITERLKAYNYLQPLGTPDIAPIHDALCVMYLLDPTVITKKEFLHVDVVCGGIANGLTLVDTRIWTPDPKNVNVCFATDTAKFREMICSIFERSVH